MHMCVGDCTIGMLALDHLLMYPTSKNYYQAVFREYMVAIGVLALILLSFAHQPIGRDDNQVFRFADGSIPVFCGSVPAQGQSSAQVEGCDACRISGGATIPDAPYASLQAFALVAKLVFAVSVNPALSRFISGNANPRAPPIHLNN